MAESEHQGQTGPQINGRLSRRDFLKLSGIAAASVGVGGGLSSLLGACGSTGDTSSTTSSVRRAVTTAVVGAETGKEIKIGYIMPINGASSELGAAAKWGVDYFNQNVWKNGVVAGDGKRHRLTLMMKDMHSDANQSSGLASDLILNSEIMLIAAAAGAGNVIAVRDTAETLECPCITYDCPGESWNTTQPAEGFKWSYHTWFTLKDMAANFTALWSSGQTNGKIGLLYPNDDDGKAFTESLPPLFKEKGFTVVDPGRYEVGTTDFSTVLAGLRKEGVEIVSGVPSAADFAVFWGQAVTQGLIPKISTESKALLLPSGIAALGTQGDGQTVECWFHPKLPYESEVTSLMAQDICDAYEKDKKKPWSQALGYVAQLEIITDILSRCRNPLDTKAIMDAVKETKVTTMGGPVDWTTGKDAGSGFRNFSAKPVAVGQWVKGASGTTGTTVASGTDYSMEIVGSSTHPEILATAALKAVGV